MPRKITKKRATTRKPTKKVNSTTKKLTTKKIVKKKAKKIVKTNYVFPKNFKPYHTRMAIKLSSKVYNALIKTPSTDGTGFPKTFLLGEDNKQIIREMVKLSRKTYNQHGCCQMPDISTEVLTEGYLKLVKQNLMPVAICRMRNSFRDMQGEGYWCDNAGPALKQVGVILTVAKNKIVAEVFVPRFPSSRGTRDKQEYWAGTYRDISVLLTDK